MFLPSNNEQVLKCRSAVTSPMSSFENNQQQIVGCGGSSSTTSGSLSPTIAKLLNCIPLKKFSNAGNTISVDLSSPSTTPRTNAAIQNCTNELQNSVLNNPTDLFDFRRSGVYLGNETSNDSVLEMLKQKKRLQRQFDDEEDNDRRNNKPMSSTNGGNVVDKEEEETFDCQRQSSTTTTTSNPIAINKSYNNGEHADNDVVVVNNDIGGNAVKLVDHEEVRPVFVFGSPPTARNSDCVSSPEEVGKESGRRIVEPVQVSSASSRYSTPSSSMSPKTADDGDGGTPFRQRHSPMSPCSPSTSYYNGIKATEEQMRKLLRRSHSLASSDLPAVVNKDGQPVATENKKISETSPRNVSHPVKVKILLNAHILFFLLHFFIF